MSALPETGDTVRLKWNGFPQVPRYMDGWLAEVVRGPRLRMLPKGGHTYLVRVRLITGQDAGKERTVQLAQVDRTATSA